MTELNETDRAVLNALQDDFPLSPRPFETAAKALGLAEDDLIARVARLKDAGVITRFGPFFDAAAMGGAFCLCALEAPADRFDAVAEIVNAFPQVAHNYARDHHLNMWFVLATETQSEIADAVNAIQEATGLGVYAFPKLKEFFVGFRVAV